MNDIMATTVKDDTLRWTSIVITCAAGNLREGVEEECKRLSSGGLLPPHDNLLVVEDPQPLSSGSADQEGEKGPTTGVGSGGATINAILVAAERLSAQLHHTTVTSEVVEGSRILVVHIGRHLPHTPGGSVLLRVSPSLSCVPPRACTTPPTLLQHNIWMATKMSSKTGAGVWVTSLDTFIPNTADLRPPLIEGCKGAVVVTQAASLQHAALHGVVVTDHQDNISRMEYRMPLEELNKIFRTGVGRVISGLVFLSTNLTERLLGLHTQPPLDRCTYYGTDSGIAPLQMSLYFDLLAPLCCGTSYDQYVSGQCGAMYSQAASYSSTSHQESQAARMQIWKHLHGLKATLHEIKGAEHHYLSSGSPYKHSIMPLLPAASNSFGDSENQDRKSDVVTVNGIIQGCVTPAADGKVIHIIDSWIGEGVSLTSTDSCVLSGVQLLSEVSLNMELVGECVWQMYPSEGTVNTVTCYGMSDDLTATHLDPTATIFNTTWSDFFTHTAIEKKDLWIDPDSKNQTVLTAKLFPTSLPVVKQMKIMVTLVRAVINDQFQVDWKSTLAEWRTSQRTSIQNLMNKCELMNLVKLQEAIYLETVKKYIMETADDMEGKSLLPLFNYIVTRPGGEAVEQILTLLHHLLDSPRPSTSRLLANVADLLGCLASGRGGLRSGPAANPQWRNALMLLKNGKQEAAVELMLEVCKKWMKSGNPEDLIRAARHYERASQIVIAQQVETAGQHVWWWRKEKVEGVGVVGMGVWVEAACPARLDLAGGWSDTPPICYEQGGAVLNVAIKVNNKKPITARVRVIPETKVVCVLGDWCGGETRLTWTHLDHLRDYDNPMAPGALIKAVLLYCRLVDPHSSDSLASQLRHRCGGGVEVEVCSHLPQGSGLGGSSLVAGTLVAAVAALLGYPLPSHTTLIHATLCIEQWLTTGGGWQDQVGGLVGGVKLGVSGRGTPVTVSSYRIPLSQQFIYTLSTHLLLLYTGKVRLARNLLQTVIRNWYARDPTITSCFAQLQQLGVKAAGAMLEEDIQMLGTCIDRYWELKKMVASGCEPTKVTVLMATLRTHCLGMALAGAGGGGYLYALKAGPQQLSHNLQLGDLTCDCVEVDEEGLVVQVDGQLLSRPTDENEILTKEQLVKLQIDVSLVNE
ncbi:hypothetical protein Pcinc_035600 [Petrolisthes cinctipes]|uniref:Fucokinase n=1 Tax=Petrolisthes cinctipes TaxID=88211 RepID=A0AAE1EMT6_PETCI|nr:hypothetical protein Pcinc_035600 [Petrolisthes cinctipes]